MDYISLFNSQLKNVKRGNNGQFTARCPFHDDTKHSFSGNYYSGGWRCFACGVEGYSEKFAKMQKECF